MTVAAEILTKAAGHMQDRASAYDKPEGERSMAQTVAIFNLYHGTELTEAQGWHLLQILKDVRLFTRAGYHADSAEDCVAYAALKAEALAAADIDRGYAELLDKSSAVHQALKGAAESFLAEQAGDWADESLRQDAAAEDEAFAAIEASQSRIDSGPMWAEWSGGKMPVRCDVYVEVRMRDGSVERGDAEVYAWSHTGGPWDVMAWREPWPEDQPYTGKGGVMIQCPGCVALSCECRP